MKTATDSLTSDHQSQQKEMSVIPRPILSTTETPVVVILAQDSDDSTLDDYWRFCFDKLASKFEQLGVHAITAPCLTTPLNTNSSNPYIYIANLVWGYHHVTDQWNAWLRAWPKEALLINSPSLLLWNTRKTYLQDLQKAGISVIPTLYVEHIDEKTLIDAAAYFSTSDLIVKPQVSASGFNLVRVVVDSTVSTSASKSLSISAAITELTRLDAVNSLMMIQPFMPSVVQEGEISVMVFNGSVAYAVRKNADPNDYRVQFEYGGVTTAVKDISNEILELAHDVIAVCPEIPAYARVDMMRDTSTGRLCISELELIEPDLFLEHAPDEGMTFVRAVLQASSRNSS